MTHSYRNLFYFLYMPTFPRLWPLIAFSNHLIQMDFLPLYISYCSFFYFWLYQDLNSGLCFARQVLYHLSHSSSPFCSGYFGDRVLLFAQTGLDCDPPILGFPQLLEWQVHATTPSFFFHWDEVSQTFFLTQAGLEPGLNLSLPCSWDDRCMPQCPKIG
jgi:hypothetical protein